MSKVLLLRDVKLPAGFELQKAAIAGDYNCRLCTGNDGEGEYDMTVSMSMGTEK